MFGIQFYPTPDALVEKMVNKLSFPKETKSIALLEPSAGKGNIVDGFIKYFIKKQDNYYELLRYTPKETRKVTHFDLSFSENKFLASLYNRFNVNFESIDNAQNWLDNNFDTDDLYYEISVKHIEHNKNIKYMISCIEKDKDLCSVLNGKNYFTINADFLEYNTFTDYDVILMNPPFFDGDKHLLKALELIENGGQCVCILNAETIRNVYTNLRRELVNKLTEYNADIEFLKNSFTDAERTTDVEIALIYVNIPKKEVTEDLLKNLLLGDDYKFKYDEYNDTQLATNDIIKNILMQYELEAKLGIKIIRDFYSMQKYIPKVKNSDDVAMIDLVIPGCSDEFNKDLNPINRFIRGLREKYWSILFMSNDIGKLLTEDSRRNYLRKLTEFRDYDFTLSNIKQLQIDMVQNLNQNIDEAILKQFDNFTYKYSMDKQSNVHYFNGWKTNSAFMIKSKVIIPIYCIYQNYYGWQLYKSRNYLEELEKIFVYLDTGETEGKNIASRFADNDLINYNGERIDFKYFQVEFKKKGTIHIWFTNEELLKKFNVFGCQKHGWLPNSYGKKAYEDMSKEEQNVIDSFEGKHSYEKVMLNPQFYFSNNKTLLLTGE